MTYKRIFSLISFKNLSIKIKLVAIILLISTFSICLVAAFYIYRNYASFKSNLISDSIAKAKLLGDHCVIPLAFSRNKEDVEVTLSKLKEYPNVISSYVFDQQGHTFAAFNDEKTIDAPMLPPASDSIYFESDFLHVFQPITFHDEKYGTIYLKISTKELKIKNNQILFYSGLIIGLITIISLLSAIKLQTIITAPILKLANHTQKISLAANYSVRINKESNDEVGVFFDGFNNMLEQIEIRQEELNRQLAEKEVLLKEVHHRIKNNIASIGGLISLRLQSITNPEAINVLRDASSRVDSMRILYDKLLVTEGYHDISVKNYLDGLIDTVVAIFPDQAKVTVKKDIADFQLDTKSLFPLGIIINELLTNSMKYAFSGQAEGSIRISLAHADRHVTLTVQDDGCGLPDGFDINESQGFGLMLVKMLSQQLGGSFSMEKQAGTRCTVKFNIDSIKA
ncbi:MAG: histidine kinase dimerization/phosphoacceptor domain -containing protein [Chrysiogenia bacterium]